jgi:hypothetical protein
MYYQNIVNKSHMQCKFHADTYLDADIHHLLLHHLRHRHYYIVGKFRHTCNKPHGHTCLREHNNHMPDKSYNATRYHTLSQHDQSLPVRMFHMLKCT